jgi:hypothetical protein
MAASSIKISHASSCFFCLRTNPDDVATGGPCNISLLDRQLPDAAAGPIIFFLFVRRESVKLNIKVFNLLHVPTELSHRKCEQNYKNCKVLYLKLYVILHSFTQPDNGLT